MVVSGLELDLGILGASLMLYQAREKLMIPTYSDKLTGSGNEVQGGIGFWPTAFVKKRCGC